MKKSPLPPIGSTDTLGAVRLNVISAVGNSCNFCNNPNSHVNEISGNQIIVRMCDNCLASINKQKSGK